MRCSILVVLSALSNIVCAQNAYLTNGFVPRYWKAGTDYPIEVRVRNSSSGALLTSFHVDWRYNNGAVQVGEWQNSTGIGISSYHVYLHQIPFNQPAGDGTLKMWVVGIGDTDHGNDTLTFPVNVLATWATKSVLIEQYTGTWCLNCPPANELTNVLNDDPLIVVAKHHNTDEFSNANSTAYWVQYNADYSPACVMEQGEGGAYPANAAISQWLGETTLRKSGVSPVSIGIQSGFSTWTRELTVDVAATFTAAQSGTFSMNAYIVEDNVPGPQSNAPPNYIHHQVVREILGGPTGTSGVIPANTSAGATYGHQYTFTVPQEWDHGNLRIIAMVTEHRSGKIGAVNVASSGITAVGIDEHVQGPSFNAFPNPGNDALWLTIEDRTRPVRITVLATDGRVVIDQRSAQLEGTIEVSGFDRLAPGAYVLRVEQGGLVREQHVMRTAGTDPR